MRFFLEFSYNGASYHGWQKQSNVISVQEEINRALSTILHTNIEVIGAGRTDAGVHAKQMFGHFDCNIDFEIQNLIFKLNNLKQLDRKSIFKVAMYFACLVNLYVLTNSCNALAVSFLFKVDTGIPIISVFKIIISLNL